MKIFRFCLCVFGAGLVLAAQTFHLGQHVYYSEEGAINLAADASLAVRSLKNDYVPFVLYMGTDVEPATIPRENVLLTYEGQVIGMPSLKDFRSEYRNLNRDIQQYNSVLMGTESLIKSRMRDYLFDWTKDFYPSQSSGRLAAEEAGISNRQGFQTFAYFKNPGFMQGDQVVIRVFDKNNKELWGAVTVVLE